MSASVGLLASACQTVPAPRTPVGVIVGKVDPVGGPTSVRAISDDGRKHRAKVRPDGSFQFKRLPYGNYSLEVTGLCESWDGGRVILQEAEHSIEPPAHTQDCIIVGMAQVEDDRA